MDRIHRCSSAQKQAYVLLVQRFCVPRESANHSKKLSLLTLYRHLEDIQDASLRQKQVYSAGGGNMKRGVEVPCAREVLRLVQNKEDHARLEEALEHIHTCVADFMDDFGLRVQERYRRPPGSTSMPAVTQVARPRKCGINWYLSMVRGASALTAPGTPDNEMMQGFADHWQA